jgi:hypothetical protein
VTPTDRDRPPATVGILMLDTRFPRPPGDIGNPATWPFPVRYAVVKGASPDLVVRRGAEAALTGFVAAARDLVRAGADGITTSCGFLALIQDRLSAAVDVPVLASSLVQVAWVDTMLPPGRRAGILTISDADLSPAHLAAAGVPPDTPLGAIPAGATFRAAILGDAARFDIDRARAETVAAARTLQAAHPALGAIVLECTNMGPYAADIAQATGLPVFSIETLITWFQAGLRPRHHPAPSASGPPRA